MKLGWPGIVTAYMVIFGTIKGLVLNIANFNNFLPPEPFDPSMTNISLFTGTSANSSLPPSKGDDATTDSTITRKATSSASNKDEGEIRLRLQTDTIRRFNSTTGVHREEARDRTSTSPATDTPTLSFTHTLQPFRSLPSFNNTGVILFYHLPKTGGVTIRKNFNNNTKLNNVEYVRAWNKTHLQGISKHIDAILTKRQKKILFVELHGGEPGTRLPGLVEMHRRMQIWRKASRDNHVPFFSFTLLREPVSVHVSAFLFFHRRACWSPWCSENRHVPLEQNVLGTVTPNRQCMALARGQHHEDYWVGKPNVTAQECQGVEALLRQDYDWVGRTEDLSNTTLPLLFEMLQHKELAKEASNFNVNNLTQFGITLSTKTLKRRTKQALLDLSTLDTKLYEAFPSGSLS